MAFNLYEDESTNETQQVTNNARTANDETILFLDIERDSLFELTQKIRNFTINRPSGSEIKVYIVSGHTANRDLSIFVDYVKSLDYDFTFIIRGIVHCDFLQLLVSPKTLVESNTKFFYCRQRLHDTMASLMENPKVFRLFVQRFIDHYHKQPSDFYLDVTELQTLGFEFQTY